MTIIEVPDMNDSMTEFVIDETVYLLRFTYSEKYDCWNFGIYDMNEDPVVAMTRIVPNYPLVSHIVKSNMPKGNFAAVSLVDRIGYEDFQNGNVQFMYYTDDEYIDALEDNE